MNGLSTQEVLERRAKGLGNRDPVRTSRSYFQIVRENVFTFVNLVLLGLGTALVLLGRPSDAIVSVLVILINVIVSVFQEIRAKRTLDRIALLTRPKATVLRDGQELDFRFERALIQGFDFIYSETKDTFRTYLEKEYPDLKVSIHHLIEDGNLVAVYLTNVGTNPDYNRQAVWDEFDIYRLVDGKIVEGWGLEDYFSQVKQLGYMIEPPPA